MRCSLLEHKDRGGCIAKRWYPYFAFRGVKRRGVLREHMMMSSMVEHKAEIAIKPEHVVSSYYPVKSEEVETDNEEDTNTSNYTDQHINIKDEHRVKVEVKTEDDDISTDDEGISNNNKSTVELQSSRLADTQATTKAIAKKKSNCGCWIDHIKRSASKDYNRLAILQKITTKTKEDRKEVHRLRQRIRRYRTRVMDAEEKGYDHVGCKKLLSYLDAKDLQARQEKQIVPKTKRTCKKRKRNNSANSFWNLEDDTRSSAEGAIRQRVGYRYHVACNKRVCITTYKSFSQIKRVITTKGPLYYDGYDFTRFCTKFKESDLDDVYPKVDGRGQLFPPPQYLTRGELVRKWRQFSEAEQLNICNNHILPIDEDEEVPPLAEPLTLPKDYMGTISDKKIDELALKVNLRRLLSLTSQIELNPTLLHTSIKAPIHVTGCSTSWRVVLHSIRYFYELDKAQQLEEVWKERFLLRAQRSHYNAKVRYLHKHRTSNAETKDDRALDQARQAFLGGQANEKALQARKAYLDRYW